MVVSFHQLIWSAELPWSDEFCNPSTESLTVVVTAAKKK